MYVYTVGVLRLHLSKKEQSIYCVRSCIEFCLWLTSNIGRPRPLRSNVPDKITLFENFLSYPWQQWILVSLICFWVFGTLPDTVEQCPNILGLLNWYCWILARVGCKNARACECILKPTNANIHQYQFNNSFIVLWRYRCTFFK